MSNVRLENLAAGKYRVSGQLTFDTVPDVSSTGSIALVEGAEIEVDLGSVARADSAGLALLVEWQSEARSRGAHVRFLNLPQQLQALIRVAGLEAAFAA